MNVNGCMSRYKGIKEVYSGRKYEMLFWDMKSSLVVKDTEPSDSATYKCVCTNALGKVESQGTLRVLSKSEGHLVTSIDGAYVIICKINFTLNMTAYLFRVDLCR